MELIIDPAGGVRRLYDEAIDLPAPGRLSITRASRVEPDEGGSGWSDMARVGGQHLGPFGSRSSALSAERRRLEDHLIG